jgi:predicted O-methyltransferase YrrM
VQAMSEQPHQVDDFCSPIVTPDESVLSYVARYEGVSPSELAGIALDLPTMRDLWLANLKIVRSSFFDERPGESPARFNLSGPFPFGDALALRLIMASARPSQIIEIGSGFSTACMLDQADQLGLQELQITCIEPYPDRLLKLLRPGDHGRVEVLRERVQSVPVEIVEKLNTNDILFIDSSHILKTASDVHYELFQLLPRLKRGVLVHFHDCMYPFEYPTAFINPTYSWNEAYALRAFLCYNSKFSILYWGSALRRFYINELADEYPTLLSQNPGGSIWLRVA